MDPDAEPLLLDDIGPVRGASAAMMQLYAGGLRPIVDRVMPLEEAAEAHRRMEQAQQFGKIVLKV